MNDINALLMASARTAACNVLIALLILGPAPVAGGAIATTCKIDDASASRSLDVLHQLGLVAYDGTGRYRTNWRLTPSGRHLCLGIFELAHAISPSQYLPAALPLVDRPVDNPAPDPLQADIPTLLQAGEPANPPSSIPVKRELSETPSKQGGAVGQNNPRNSDLENDGLIIILDKEETLNLSKTIIETPIPAKPDLARDIAAAQAQLISRRVQSRGRRQSRHIRDLTSALLAKGRPVPSGAELLSAAQRAVVERLVSVTTCPQERAELAVARSPWTAETMLEQINVWLAYKDSPQARTITTSGFPFLVAARIEKGKVCPVDVRGGANDPNRFDGYIPHITDPEQP